MAVYVDAGHMVYGRQWCHMVADTTEELDAMARRIGAHPSWKQFSGEAKEHYDLQPRLRAKAVAAGAIEVRSRALVELIRAKRAESGAA